MPLTDGTRLGPYQVLSAIGAGGMGDVYKARDTRLDRIVALKVSREQFTERFETEARATAALDHPHICRLYDISHEENLSFLVMEYVEGTPLKGPLPLDQALVYAGQIADALDEAHRKQIIHRDLKPSNVLVTPKGGIKLLDFGLAKFGRDRDTPLDDAALTEGLTAAGTILGTLHYMSPEQLQGAPADTRSDIFAFGLVLYEMLAGKRAFDGASAASIIAAILERPAPSVSEIAPPALDRLLKRCLAKDPDDRWQSARDIKAALELVAEPSRLTSVSQPTPLRTSSLWPWLAAGALAAALAALAFVHFREVPPRAEVVRFQIPAPEGTTIVSAPFLSPDGRSIAFVASGADGKRLIWVRRIDSVAARVLTGTENANPDPFWSPDSRFIAFAADGKLKKIDLSGGAAQVLCDTSNIAGGSWNADGVIVFSEFQSGLLRVPQTGGVTTRLTTLDAAINETFHALPQFLPDGRHFIFTAVARERANNAVYLATLDGKERKRLPVDGRIRVVYAPPLATAGPGHLIFLRDETLVAQPVDNVTFETAGEAVPLAELGTESALGLHSVSAEGTLAYRTGDLATATQLVWFDREGKALGTVGLQPDTTIYRCHRTGRSWR